MLKHVSYRSSSVSLSRPSDTVGIRSPSGRVVGSYATIPGRCHDNADYADNVSMTSSMSFSSLANEKFSSMMSLNDQARVPVKIYLRRLRGDMEYKTVCLSLRTTCAELVRLLLAKFRLRHRDPNLFFVMMEVTVRPAASCDARADTDGDDRFRLALDDAARPAELQQCRPKGQANFSIGVRRGGLVRVHDSILNPGSQYKSLMVANNTTSEQLIQLLLNCYNSAEDPNDFSLHEICKTSGFDRRLLEDQKPTLIQSKWPSEKRDQFMFVLRRKRNLCRIISVKPKLTWRRSLDQSSNTDTESECSDPDTTRASIMSSASSSSSGVSSDDGSSCCSVESIALSSPRSSPGAKASPKALDFTSSPVTSTPSKIGQTGKPPRPVPRTLFPPSPPRRKASLPLISLLPSPLDEEDSGIVADEEDEITPPKVAASPSSLSSKLATIKSLSKSSSNLSFISPLSKMKSKSTLNLSASETSTPKEGLGVAFKLSEAVKLISPIKFSSAISTSSNCKCRSCFYI